MFEDIFLFFRNLPKYKASVLLLILFQIINAILEMASILSIYPFLVITSESKELLGYDKIIIFANYFDLDKVSLLKVLIFISLTFVVFSQFFRVFLKWYERKVIYDIWQVTYINYFNYYLSKSLTYFTNVNTKEITSKIRDHIHNACVGFFGPFIKLVGDIITIIIFLPLVLINFTQNSLIFVSACAIFMIFLYRSIRKKIDEFGAQLPIFSEKSLIISSEAFEQYKNIKIYDAKNFFIERIIKISKKYVKSILGISLLSNIPPAFVEIIAYLIGLVFLYSMVVINQIEMIEIIPVVALIALILRKLLPTLSSVFQQITSLRYYYNTYEQIKTEIIDSNSSNINFESFLNSKSKMKVNKISIKNLYFSYGRKNIINNFNYEIIKGDKLLIKGQSGSGKSTLINLLTGFIKPSNGEITINGNDINNDIYSFYNSLSYVSQENFFLDGTLMSNIVLFEENIDENFLRECLEISDLSVFVDSLDQDIHSNIGENANKLSVGQKQRLAIARALYRKPELLILDESTSNLDIETEKKLLNNLLNCNFIETIIFVSHRNTLSNKFNKIIKL